MISNREISRLFSLYAELLQLHNKNEGLANLLSGASYRIRRIDEPLGELKKDQRSKLFRPELMSVFDELKKSGRVGGKEANGLHLFLLPTASRMLRKDSRAGTPCCSNTQADP